MKTYPIWSGEKPAKGALGAEPCTVEYIVHSERRTHNS